MQLWRLSGAAFAERFDGGFGLEHDGRWNGRGRPITSCSTGPSLCVLEKLAHIEEAGLLPGDTMLVRYPHLTCIRKLPVIRTKSSQKILLLLTLPKNI